MSQSDPSEPRWTWAGAATAAWFHRRIAQETMVHRIDAELTCNQPVDAVEPLLAADGIEEFMDVFMPASTGDPIGSHGESILLQPNDISDGWLVVLQQESATMTRVERTATPDATITGRALDLLLVTWGREPLQSITVTGSWAAVDLFKAAAKL